MAKGRAEELVSSKDLIFKASVFLFPSNLEFLKMVITVWSFIFQLVYVDYSKNENIFTI